MGEKRKNKPGLLGKALGAVGIYAKGSGSTHEEKVAAGRKADAYNKTRGDKPVKTANDFLKGKSKGTGATNTKSATKGAALKPSLKSGKTAGTKVGTGVTTTRGYTKKPNSGSNTKPKAPAKKKAPMAAAPKKTSTAPKKKSGVQLMNPKAAKIVREARMKHAVEAGRKKRGAAAKPMKRSTTAKKSKGRRMSAVDKAKGHFA